MAGFCMPGVTCVTQSLTILDVGTNALAAMSTPGTVEPSVPLEYRAFKAWAMQEAETGAAAIDARAWFGDYETISKLSGDFLRMYLAHTADPDVVKAAGEEIGASAEWAALSEEVQEAIQKESVAKQPTAADVARIARAFLKNKYVSEGIAFRGALNPIIGGIEGVDVIEPAGVRVQVIGTAARVQYSLSVQLKDKYKFLGNKRSGGAKGTIADQSEYDAQRQRWAQLLQKGEYGTVFKEYHAAFFLGSEKVNGGAAFASFMYAIEGAGMTPGPLEWSVVVVMEGEVKSVK